jgi:nucleoside-diphosphate-sugar epimerase
MKILMIGGTGIISEAVTKEALRQGLEVYLLNRGTRPQFVPSGCHVIKGEVGDGGRIASVLAERRYDAVVDWICFTPEQVLRDIEYFKGKVGQYVFISSASAYNKPVAHYRIRESTTLHNPEWQYSRDKVSCEELLVRAYRDAGFPATIVRPSHTYGEQYIPWVYDGSRQWSVVDRILEGKPVIVPGDGTSLWTITHNTDFAKAFVGLLGHPKAVGDSFHITGDEVVTWDYILQRIADAVGAKAKPYHISSDFLSACVPEWRGGLLGDKSQSVVFDNSKVKELVPAFVCTTPFHVGIRLSVEYFKARPELQAVDEEWDLLCDRLIASHEEGMRSFKEGK